MSSTRCPYCQSVLLVTFHISIVENLFHSYALWFRINWCTLPPDSNSSARKVVCCDNSSSTNFFASCASSSFTVAFSAFFFGDFSTFSSSATEVHSFEFLYRIDNVLQNTMCQHLWHFKERETVKRYRSNAEAEHNCMVT